MRRDERLKPGETLFVCPDCCAEYGHRIERVPFRDQDSAHCSKCEKLLENWNGGHTHHFRLLDNP